MNIGFITDTHATASTPLCRLDDYYTTQIRKYKFIDGIIKEYNAVLLNGGDLIDKDVYRSSIEAINTFNLLQANYPDSLGIAGNHDVPYRSYDYLDRSILSMLINSGKFKHITESYNIPDTNVWIHPFNWETRIQHIDKVEGSFNIALWHEYIGNQKDSIIGGSYAKDIVKEFHEDFQYILTGDNHKYFVEKYKGCTLINGGSLVRKTADQINDQPYLHMIDTEAGEYTPIPIPIEEGVISRKHIEIQKDRENNMASFVINMDEEYEVTEKYEKNLELYIAENKFDDNEIILINKNVEKFINKALEGDSEYEL